MDKILLAITQEIKEEVSKDDLDWVKLKNLVAVALDVKNMVVDSLTGFTPGNQGVALVGRPRAAAYGPPPTERLLNELVPQAFALLKLLQSGRDLQAVEGLSKGYETLKGSEPKLASKIKARLETILEGNENQKEETDETVHS